jgi:hypothetical protein
MVNVRTIGKRRQKKEERIIQMGLCFSFLIPAQPVTSRLIVTDCSIRQRRRQCWLLASCFLLFTPGYWLLASCFFHLFYWQIPDIEH